MRAISVAWSDGTVTHTNVNGAMAEIRAYYVGQRFNVGDGGNDRFLTAVAISEDAAEFGGMEERPAPARV